MNPNDPYLAAMIQREQEPVCLEIEREQVRHIDLAEYQPGCERYERLMHQLKQAQRFQQPEDLRFNF